MLEGFGFGTPTIAKQLTGKLDALRQYNGLSIPPSNEVRVASARRF